MSNALLERQSRHPSDAVRARVGVKVAAVAAASGEAVGAVALAVWETARMAFNLSDELRRLADEWEPDRPAQAALLRKAARQGWGW